jgi:hypothetical protein
MGDREPRVERIELDDGTVLVITIYPGKPYEDVFSKVTGVDD